MDELGSSLPALAVILVLTVSATVFLIQKLKMLVCTQWKGAWTQKIPGWFWLVLSIAVPFGVVVFMIQPWMQAWINGFLPESMRLTVSPQNVMGTGVVAVFGSQGSYALAKKAGLTGDYSPGGPNDVTPKTMSAPEVTPQVAPVVISEMPSVSPETAPSIVGVIPEPTPFPEQETPADVPSVQTVLESSEPAAPSPPTYAHLLAYCSSDPDLVLIDGDPPIVVPVQSEEMKAWATSPPKTHSW